MPYFARVRDGVVTAVHRINGHAMTDENGTEQEDMGKQFLADLYKTEVTEWVMTYYPIDQPEPFPRGKYAGIGDRYDADTDTFISPQAPEVVEPAP